MTTSASGRTVAPSQYSAFMKAWESIWEISAESGRTELTDLSGEHPCVAAELSSLYDGSAKRCSVMDWSVIMDRRGDSD